MEPTKTTIGSANEAPTDPAPPHPSSLSHVKPRPPFHPANHPLGMMPVAPATFVSHHPPAALQANTVMPGMRMMRPVYAQPPMMVRPAGPSLIPVPLNSNLMQWLRPISVQCSLEQFFRVVVAEHVLLEALNLFFIFYYNRPVERFPSIPMLPLLHMVMAQGGFHAVRLNQCLMR